MVKTKVAWFYWILLERFRESAHHDIIDPAKAREIMGFARIKKIDSKIILKEMIALGLLQRTDRGGRLLKIIKPKEKVRNDNWFAPC